MREWPSDLEATVRQLLRELACSGTTDEARIAHRFGALPLYADLGGCIALSPTGDWLSVGWEANAVPQTPDSRWRLFARVAGARKYPALSTLLPERAPDNAVCDACDETGEIAGATCGQCAGLGWLS